MTRLALGRLTALMALLGLFAMHGFTAGHDSGHCMAAIADTTVATTNGAPVHHPGGHSDSLDMTAAAGSSGSTVGSPSPAGHVVIDAAGSVMAVGAASVALAAAGPMAAPLHSATPAAAELVAGALDCGPVGAGGVCLAVLLISLLLALLLAAAWRCGLAMLDVPRLLRRPHPLHEDTAGVRPPSLAQLGVLRT